MERRDFFTFGVGAVVAASGVDRLGGMLDSLIFHDGPHTPPYGIPALRPRAEIVAGAREQRVTPNAVQLIADRAREMKRWDMIEGGGSPHHPLSAAHRAFEEAVATIRFNRNIPSTLRTDLYANTAWMGHTYGFMAFDQENIGTSTNAYAIALQLAEYAGHRPLQARIYGSMARQLVWAGRPKDATLLTGKALDTLGPHIPHLQQSMLYAIHARALGDLGDAEATREAVRQADHHWLLSNLYQERDSGIVHPSCDYFGAADMYGDTSRAYKNLVEAHMSPGDPVPARYARDYAEAVTRAQDASTGLACSVDHVRSHALTDSGLAVFCMRTGEPDRAVTYGARACDTAATVTSSRLRRNLHELRRASEIHRRRPDVANLRERVDLTLVA